MILLLSFLYHSTISLSNLADKLLMADIHIESGKISTARELFDSMYPTFKNNEAFVKRHTDFLFLTGNFEELLRKYEKSKNSYLKGRIDEARKYREILSSGNTRNIAELMRISNLNIDVLKAYIMVNLADGKYNLAEPAINKGLRIFTNDLGLFRLQAQYFFLIGSYTNGIIILRKIGENDSAARFEEVNTLFENTKKSLDSKRKLASLESILKVVQKNEIFENYTPSIYKTFLEHLSIEIVKTAVDLSLKGYSGKANAIYDKKSSDENLYFYVTLLSNENNFTKARRVLASHVFSDKNLRVTLEKRISGREQRVREEEEEKARQEEQKRNRERRRNNNRGGYRQSAQKGSDFLDYYKVLGVKTTASEAEIKKAYMKIFVANKTKKKTKQQEKEWEELFTKINKARGVLLDKKKRELYDNGIDPDNPQPQMEYGATSFDDLFKHFGQFNGFEEYGRGARRTYFYFG